MQLKKWLRNVFQRRDMINQNLDALIRFCRFDNILH